MKKIILLTLTAILSFPIIATAADKKPAKVIGCDPNRTTRGIIVMDDGDLVRFKANDMMEYSKDKGVTWHDIVSDGSWGTMDGRKLTSQKGKFVSLQ